MIPNTLELASHQRAAHGLDLETYVRANGHSRVHTAHIDCALCAESVMHDLGAFRRHLVVVHAGVSMDEYYRCGKKGISQICVYYYRQFHFAMQEIRGPK